MFFLAGTSAYDLGFDDFTGGESYCQLMKCFDVLNKMNASASDAWDWMSVDLAADNSANIKQTAKSRYNETEWLKVAAPLRDLLREKQRDALTAYLIQNRGFEDVNALYGYYLMDVATSACTNSSRIVLANSSVQLFIQRHLMNLEVETLDLDAERWQWMKNYRVWEANRKVFLYPESFVEPELRMVKSPFFTDLQHALLENDVTADLVEAAIKAYLAKLDEVSNIEVCGTYHQKEAGFGITAEEIAATSIDVLHVFGSTGGVTVEYYYRTYINNSYWTPWERVNLAIEGKHLLPVIINRSLHLFWPEFMEMQEEVTEATTLRYWEIRLAYSELKNGQWVAKKNFAEYFDSDKLNVALALVNGTLNLDNYGLHNFSFLTRSYASYLVIECIQRIDLGLGTTDQYGEGIFKFYFDTRKLVTDNFIPVMIGLDTLKKPTGTDMDYMAFKEWRSPAVELVNGDVDENGNYVGNDHLVKVLDATPGTFRIPFMHQYNEFVSQDNFFLGDDYRNFFVKPCNTPGGLVIDRNQVYVADDTTPFLNHYLGDPAIAVGIFHETTYNTHGIKEVIFGNVPDELDPVPQPGFAAGSISTAAGEVPRVNDQLSKQVPATLQTLLDTSGINTQVDQLHYLGSRMYRFSNFYHPCFTDLVRTINLHGIEKLMARELQQQSLAYFGDAYLPTASVTSDYPVASVDFSTGGAMSMYNWELFFHIPMLIAGRLSANQQFEEAQRWYHYIFNPLDRSSEPSPNKFWQFKPFFELYGVGEGAEQDSIYNLMYALSYSGTDTAMLNKKTEAEQQVEAWLANPFDPHAIAALRPVAYMKSVVMKYIDNLLAWGDFKFQQDTIESINEATMIYMLATEILGKRPELITVEEAAARTYNQLAAGDAALDVFSNALVSLENVYDSSRLSAVSSAMGDLLPKTLYFCIPNNPNLLAYWDLVEDRLFKIRHCRNIEGTVRQLPLFQPPIDPALLVKARAAGLSIGSVLNDLYAPLPHYRYAVMVQKAYEFCGDVKMLGNALLNVLEKKDAEEAAVLRASHELRLLQMMTDEKRLQLDESRKNLAALKTMRKITEAKINYYVKLEKINSKEQLYLDKLEDSRKEQRLAEKNELTAARMHKFPDVSGSVTLGVSPSVSIGSSFGGSNLGNIANSHAAGHQKSAAQLTYQATKASILGGYNRRWDEWKLQERSALIELTQIDQQITAAEIRVAIMEKDISSHNLQIENNRQVSDFLVSKFTNKELYEWMTGQLSTIYFQSYQVAYDLAKRAQRCFQFELGTDQSFITFGYWDSLKKGLLAGERLYYDIRRMEVAFLDQNKRSYELSRPVSLASHDPMALVQLRETGTCFINLPEAIFDLDHPGHYLRRIRSVELTLPCVTGPYTTINCKLTLLANKWRKDSSGDDYPESTSEPDGRFVYNTGGVRSIATSGGVNDSGLFQLNFSDERYLPFEGAGAISSWQLELPSAMRSFDYNTLSDVIMQVSYTARDGGDLLRMKAADSIRQSLGGMEMGSNHTGLTRMFSLRHEFANDWYRFLNPPAEQEGQQVVLKLDGTRFPYMFNAFELGITMVEIIVLLDDAGAAEKLPVLLTPPLQQPALVELDASAVIGGQLFGLLETPSAKTGDWLISVAEDSIPAKLGIASGSHMRLNTEIIKNMIVLLSYTI